MKINRLLFLTIFFCLVIFVPALSAPQNEIKLYLNGNILKTDVAPVIVDDRTLVPARAIFEELGASVTWNSDEKRVDITCEKTEITLYVDSVNALVNGEEKKLDVCATIINDRTMIPVRFVSESLGYKVGWQSDYTVTIDENKETVEQKPTSVKNTNTLKSISLDSSDGGVRIIVEGVGDIKPDVMELIAPYRLVFDFKDCTFTADKFVEGEGVVESIRAAQFEPDTSRVVVDLPYFPEYRILSESDNLIIELGKYNSHKNYTELASEYISDISLKKGAKNKLVILDAGHGGSEVGTIGEYFGEEVLEKDINLKITLLVNEMLKNNGVMTYMIRDDDTYVGISQRPDIANEKNGYIYFSIHNNASENKDINGVQIYYSEKTPTFENVTNKEIATVFYDNISELGLHRAGIVDNPRYIVIYKSQMPAFIIENAFVSNEEDLDKLMDDEFIYNLAEKICDSVIEALNITL